MLDKGLTAQRKVTKDLPHGRYKKVPPQRKLTYNADFPRTTTPSSLTTTIQMLSTNTKSASSIPDLQVHLHAAEDASASCCQDTLGYLYIAADTRYKAVRYNEAQYRLLRRSEPSTVAPNYFQEIYHSSRDLDARGIVQERDKFLQDFRDYSVSLPPDEHHQVLHLLGSKQDCDDLQGTARDLVFGFRYSENDFDSKKGGMGRYMRGFYFQAAHCEAGIVIGRLPGNGSTGVSTSSSKANAADLDECIIQNFGQAKTPSEEIKREQRGTLILPKLTKDAFTPLWTLPTNDSFVLGAIHFGRDVHLASPRQPSCLFRFKVGGQLSTFGREVAVILLSGAYELHCSGLLGETFKFVGAPMRARYNVKELMDGINRLSIDPKLQSLLGWMHSAKEDLRAGDVIVISRETVLADGSWAEQPNRTAKSDTSPIPSLNEIAAPEYRFEKELRIADDIASETKILLS